MSEKTNYQSAVERISRANTLTELIDLENIFDHLYNWGVLTYHEFVLLDRRITDKFSELTND